MTSSTDASVESANEINRYSNRDFDFFYEGLEAGRLLVQRCAACGRLRNPPGPACPSCRSLQWDAFALCGRGKVHSFTVHRHPAIPGFATPHPIIVSDMEEGIRMVAAADGQAAEKIEIDAPVRVEFCRRGPYASFRFRID